MPHCQHKAIRLQRGKGRELRTNRPTAGTQAQHHRRKCKARLPHCSSDNFGFASATFSQDCREPFESPEPKRRITAKGSPAGLSCFPLEGRIFGLFPTSLRTALRRWSIKRKPWRGVYTRLGQGRSHLGPGQRGLRTRTTGPLGGEVGGRRPLRGER
jgi:hypothetical protein